MIFDEKLLFSKDQALTTTAASTDVLDMENRTKVGRGKPLRVVVVVTEDFDGGTNLDIALQDSADDSSFANVATTGATLTASLTAGKTFEFKLPSEIRRYLRLNYTITGTHTAGKVYAGIVQD